MKKLLSKKERDRQVLASFQSKIEKGESKTKATYEVMSEFQIMTPATVYNIRRRLRSERVNG